MKRERVLVSRIDVHSISLVVLAAVVFFTFFSANVMRSPLASAETRFVEKSVQGLNIVPASCPSNPHVVGECDPPVVTASTNDPRGWLDGATCDAVGWAQDLDVPDAPITVHFYIDGPVTPGFATFAGQAIANQSRSDLCSAIGSCNHAFTFAVPAAFRDGASHTIYAYGINNVAGGNNTLLSGSP